LYKNYIPSKAVVLSCMSSWVAHLPAEPVRLRRIHKSRVLKR